MPEGIAATPKPILKNLSAERTSATKRVEGNSSSEFKTKEAVVTCNLLRTFYMVLFLTICSATVANADDAAAQTHVAAAQAAVAPAVPNPDQPFQVFEAFFKQWCAPPKQLPDVVR